MYYILQCIVCQVHQDVIYCSITFTSNLSLKERISHSRFKPTFFCVMFPNESVFYSTRATIPEVIGDSLLKLYGATRLNQLPLVGRDFRSLRQLHLNKENKGMIRRRPVEDSHPIDTDVEMSETSGITKSYYCLSTNVNLNLLIQMMEAMSYKMRTNHGGKRKINTIAGISIPKKIQS